MINLKSTNNDWLQTNYYFSGEVTGNCRNNFETTELLKQIGECREGSPAELMACCKNQGVPFNCIIPYCMSSVQNGTSVQTECAKWSYQIQQCMEGMKAGRNEGKMCCEEQGVPDECSAYCETA